jgi:O-antigen ligase
MIDKSRIALFCIIGMFAGFLVSRVVLSISMFLFGINAIRDIHPREWLKQKWWLLGLSWVAMYALSGFWSDDMNTWGEHLQTKLPFLLLPLAFSYQPRFSDRQLTTLTLSLGVMLVGAAIYSVSFFVIDPEFYTREYHISHMLPTLPKRDHIRCSMSMALFIIWCLYAWPRITGKQVRLFLGIALAILVIYLHILAAKSGLISFYIFVIAYGLYLTIAKKKIVGIIVILAIPVVGFVAMQVIPTFRERAHFVDFSYFMFKRGDKSGNISDIARIISYKLALVKIAENPLLGTGTGDMKHEIDQLYAERYPQIPEHGRLLPHNQALVVAIGCGIPAMILFLMWVAAPLRFLRRNRQSFFFFIVWLLLFLQLMIEPVLEVQFGVFMYLYFLLLQLQEIRITPESEKLA